MPDHQQTQQSKKPESSAQRRITPAIQTPVSHPAAIIQRSRINPKSLTAADVLQLQRTIGNRAVGRLLSEIRNPSKVQQVPIQMQETSEEEEPLQGKIIESIRKNTIIQKMKIGGHKKSMKDIKDTLITMKKWQEDYQPFLEQLEAEEKSSQKAKKFKNFDALIEELERYAKEAAKPTPTVPSAAAGTPKLEEQEREEDTASTAETTPAPTMPSAAAGTPKLEEQEREEDTADQLSLGGGIVVHKSVFHAGGFKRNVLKDIGRGEGRGSDLCVCDIYGNITTTGQNIFRAAFQKGDEFAKRLFFPDTFEKYIQIVETLKWREIIPKDPKPPTKSGKGMYKCPGCHSSLGTEKKPKNTTSSCPSCGQAIIW